MVHHHLLLAGESKVEGALGWEAANNHMWWHLTTQQTLLPRPGEYLSRLSFNTHSVSCTHSWLAGLPEPVGTAVSHVTSGPTVSNCTLGPGSWCQRIQPHRQQQAARGKHVSCIQTKPAPIPHHFKHHKHKCKLLGALKGQRSARCDHATHKEQPTLPLGLSRTSHCAWAVGQTGLPASSHWQHDCCKRHSAVNPRKE